MQAIIILKIWGIYADQRPFMFVLFFTFLKNN